jgi:hypothetical protein
MVAFLVLLVGILNVILKCGDSRLRLSAGRSPGNWNRPLTRRRPRHFLLFPLLYERLQKTLRHPLHAVIAMLLDPPRLEGIKLQRPMPCRTMPALARVANVDASLGSILRISYGSGRKAD